MLWRPQRPTQHAPSSGGRGCSRKPRIPQRLRLQRPDHEPLGDGRACVVGEVRFFGFWETKRTVLRAQTRHTQVSPNKWILLSPRGSPACTHDFLLFATWFAFEVPQKSSPCGVLHRLVSQAGQGRLFTMLCSTGRCLSA